MIRRSALFTIITSVAIVLMSCDLLEQASEDGSNDPCSELAGSTYNPTTLGKILCVIKSE